MQHCCRLWIRRQNLFQGTGHFIVVMLVGHWIEMRSVMGASHALEKLAELMPDEAHLVHGDQVMDVPVSELKKGDVILVKPGE